MPPTPGLTQNLVTGVATLDLLRELAPVLGETFGATAANADGLASLSYVLWHNADPGLLEFASQAGGPYPDRKLSELAIAPNGATRSRSIS